MKALEDAWGSTAGMAAKPAAAPPPPPQPVLWGDKPAASAADAAARTAHRPQTAQKGSSSAGNDALEQMKSATSRARSALARGARADAQARHGKARRRVTADLVRSEPM